MAPPFLSNYPEQSQLVPLVPIDKFVWKTTNHKYPKQYITTIRRLNIWTEK